MIIVHSNLNTSHNPAFEVNDGQLVPYAESADRATVILDALREQAEHTERSPRNFPLRHILAIHKKQYVDFLRSASQQLEQGAVLYPSYFMSDTYAPIVAGTYIAAREAANIALTGADLLQNHSVVYSLCRPPGHHADHHAMGGYCYFNNAAIAAQYLSTQGRVAILDIDFHHGNGTQNAFYERSDVTYISLHADPRQRYPYASGYANELGHGAGEGYTHNFPLPLNTNNSKYLHTLDSALVQIGQFAPDYLIVSAGFDTFCKDPIGGFKLTEPVYLQIGERIANLAIPTLIVQEGGYNLDYLGRLTQRFLQGFSSLR